MTRSRPIFNFFADLGEKIEGAPPDESEQLGTEAGSQKARSPSPSVSRGFLVGSLIVVVVSLLLVSEALRNRERLVDEAVYSALSRELSKVVPDSSAIPLKAGKIQAVDFSDRVAVVDMKNNSRSRVIIGPDTDLFIYLPSKRRLLRLNKGDVKALLRGDKVAFVQDPSGKTVALVLEPSPAATP